MAHMQNHEQAGEDKKQRNKKQTRKKQTNKKTLLYAQTVFELLIKILKSNDVFKSGKRNRRTL